MDQVVLKDLSIFAKHGVFDEEAELGQRFFIDVAIDADLTYAEREDEADATVNWADLVEVVTEAFTSRRFKLVEAAAASIASAILDHFEIASRVRVEVRKPSAPVEAIFAFTAIVVVRERKDAASSAGCLLFESSSHSNCLFCRMISSEKSATFRDHALARNDLRSKRWGTRLFSPRSIMPRQVAFLHARALRTPRCQDSRDPTSIDASHRAGPASACE